MSLIIGIVINILEIVKFYEFTDICYMALDIKNVISLLLFWKMNGLHNTFLVDVCLLCFFCRNPPLFSVRLLWMLGLLGVILLCLFKRHLILQVGVGRRLVFPKSNICIILL